MNNLFIVESPLQALIAVELSIQLKDKKNGVFFRLLGDSRHNNDSQIEKVIRSGNWSMTEPVRFGRSSALAHHLKVRQFVGRARKDFANNIEQLFIGDFRAEWMHLVRSVTVPERTLIMDDGAATISVKTNFIDNDVFYPETLWRNRSGLKRLLKWFLYKGLVNKNVLDRPLFLASAFLREESVYPITFAAIRSRITHHVECDFEPNTVFFFGSKYSESSIISLRYELSFLSKVQKFYLDRDMHFIYCAHRDESSEKLDILRKKLGIEVVIPDSPAEIFMLRNHASAKEISAAYSSALNNLRLIFPDIIVRSFILEPKEINVKNRQDISGVYHSFERAGIILEDLAIYCDPTVEVPDMAKTDPR